MLQHRSHSLSFVRMPCVHLDNTQTASQLSQLMPAVRSPRASGRRYPMHLSSRFVHKSLSHCELFHPLHPSPTRALFWLIPADDQQALEYEREHQIAEKAKNAMLEGCENAKAMIEESSFYNNYWKPAVPAVTYPTLPPNADV